MKSARALRSLSGTRRGSGQADADGTQDEHGDRDRLAPGRRVRPEGARDALDAGDVQVRAGAEHEDQPDEAAGGARVRYNTNPSRYGIR